MKLVLRATHFDFVITRRRNWLWGANWFQRVRVRITRSRLRKNRVVSLAGFLNHFRSFPHENYHAITG